MKNVLYKYIHETMQCQKLGLVVQSIVSLTKSIDEDLFSLTVLTKSVGITFFAEKF